MAPKSNPAQRFLVTTPGLSATHWLSFSLAVRPDVFVSHGKDTLGSVAEGSLESEKTIGYKESLAMGNSEADFYHNSSLEEIFAAYAEIMPKARAYGNVHAFTAQSLLPKIGNLPQGEDLRLINVWRHPVSHIESHYNLVRSMEANAEQYGHFESNMLARALEVFPDLKRFSDVDYKRWLAFAVSCLSVWDMGRSLDVPRFIHMRMEQLTSDPELLGHFCEHLTGLHYSPETMEAMVAKGPINQHRKKSLNQEPREIFDSWETWQKDMAHMMMPVQLLEFLKSLGFQVGMLDRYPARPQGKAAVCDQHPLGAEAEEKPALSPSASTKKGKAPPQGQKRPSWEKQDPGILFAKGNYTQVVLHGDRGRWEYFASLGLIGKTDEAREGLEKFMEPEARFYLGVTHWIAGEDQKAMEILSGVPGGHAANLLRLIQKPRIKVWSQMPWSRHDFSEFLAVLQDHPKFEITNLSFRPGDMPNEPYLDLPSLINDESPPDFFIARMLEWHVVPPSVQDLPCPIFAHTADYDLHIQALYPWLQIFDELLVGDHSEWSEVTPLTASPVSTFPKSFALPDRLPPLPQGARGLDVFQSGTVVHAYHPDKTGPLFEMLSLPEEMKVWLLAGFSRADCYFPLLGNIKATFTYVRRPGSMPTRGIEALSMGCGVAVQKGCALTIFAGPEEGVLTYQGEGEGLQDALRTMVTEWPRFSARARRGAEIMRREFAVERVASQYLRYLTFLAAKPRPPRKRLAERELIQKRMVLTRGWMPKPYQTVIRISDANLARWEKIRQEEGESARLLNDMARENLLDYAYTSGTPLGMKTPEKVEERKEKGLALLRRGVKRYPNSLPLRFNLVRALLYFGSKQDGAEADRLALETLARPLGSWKIDMLEDVMPWDYGSSEFDCRRYFDLCCHYLGKVKTPHAALARLIAASLHHYLFLRTSQEKHARQAVALNPDFAHYRLQMAQAIISTRDRAKVATAVPILGELTRGSIVFEQAWQTLEVLAGAGFELPPDLERERLVLERIRAGKEIREKAYYEGSGYLNFAAHEYLAGVQAKVARDPQSQISILITTKDRPRRLVRALRHYRRVGFRGWILIGDSGGWETRDLNQKAVEEFSEDLNLIYHPASEREWTHEGPCVQELSRLIPTGFAVVSGDDDILLPSGLVELLGFLSQNPDYSAVQGQCLDFQVEANACYGSVEAARHVTQKELTSIHPIERWVKLLRDSCLPSQSLVRTEILVKAYAHCNQVPCPYLGDQLLPWSLIVLWGRVARSPHLAVFRQKSGPQDYLSGDRDIFTLTRDALWAPSVAALTATAERELFDRAQLTAQDAEAHFKREFWDHINHRLSGQFKVRFGQGKRLQASNIIAILRQPGHPLQPALGKLEDLLNSGPCAGRPQEAAPAALAAQVTQGEALVQRGQAGEAEHVFRSILGTHPEHSQARNDLACVLWSSSRAQEAISELEKARRIDPRDHSVVWNLGQMLNHLGELDRARRVFEDYQDHNGVDPMLSKQLDLWTQA